MSIILLTDAWGPKHGGINSFNQDFAIGLRAEAGDTRKVFSVAVNPTTQDIADARRRGVIVIPVENKAKGTAFDTSWIFDVGQWLKENGHSLQGIEWVGHDLITGQAARRAVEQFGGSCALIHHMSYRAYQGYKHDDAEAADQKTAEQRDLFKGNARAFAVGPLLRKSLRSFGVLDVTQLIPGFPEDIKPNASSSDVISALTFGRMDMLSDRIKQGQLAVAGFFGAVRQAHQPQSNYPALLKPEFYILGIKDHEEEKKISKLADEAAGRVTKVSPLHYDENRDRLFDRLAFANLALMMSWHEGFGLVGWEAIAAEVPLILGRDSGLFELINETLGNAGLGCVRAIEVRGRRGGPDEPNYHEDDQRDVKTAVLDIAANIDRAKDDAKRLKALLIDRHQCTWNATARSFLAGTPSALGSGKTTANSHHGARARFKSEQNNAIPECAEITVSTTQGSTHERFDLLPEVRFGADEIDELGIQFGIAEAFLTVITRDCAIASGDRLGDEEHPHVEAGGGGVWRIKGPVEDGVLVRRALGADPLCTIEADAEVDAIVEFELGCRQRSIVYKPITAAEGDQTKEKIIQTFINRCLGSNKGKVILGKANLAKGEK